MKHILFILFGLQLMTFISCTNSKETEPEFNLNECSEYSCVQHRDKVSVTSDICPECGAKMVNTNLMESLLSRTAQSIHDSLTNYHNRIIGESYKINNGKVYTKEEQMGYVSEATKNLNKARLANENLELLVFGKHRTLVKPHYAMVEKLYATATYRLTTLKEELAKSDYDKNKVKIYSDELNETIYEIDKEQGIIKVKTKSKKH